MKNYYYILGVKENSTTEEIKSAYRKLSKKFHPDKNPGDKFFEERFKDIQEGYETLSDSQKKRIYDEQFKEFLFNDKTESESKSKSKNSENESSIEPIHYAKKSKRKNEDEEDSPLLYNLIQGTLVTLFCLCSLYAIYDIVISPLIIALGS